MAKIRHGFTGQRMIILPFYLFEKMESDILMNDLHIHSLGCFPNARYHYVDRPLGCTEHIFIYCKRGKGWFETNGTKHELNAEQIVILSQDTPHKYGASATNPWSIYWIHFKGRKSAMFSPFFNVPSSVLPTKGADRKNDLFEEMYDTLNYSLDSNSVVRANMCLLYFLSLFMNKRDQNATKNINYGASIVNLATHYMNENLEKRLKLNDFAEHFGFSTSYFYRLFYKSIGYAPMEYFNLLKIKRACHLLQTTDRKINEIAEVFGFDDPLYFSRLFKKIVNKSPSEFRRF